MSSLSSASREHPPVVILAFDEGGLGNRLILYAEFLELARQHRFILLNPSFAKFLGDFQLTEERGVCGHLPEGVSAANHPLLSSLVSDVQSLSRDLLKQHPQRELLEETLSQLTPASIVGPLSAIHQGLLLNVSTILVEGLRDNSLQAPLYHLIHQRDETFDLSSASILQQIRPDRITLFHGWNFRYRAIPEHAREPLIHDFALASKHLEPLRELLARIRRPGELLIGMHIRWGDYQDFQGGKFFYPLSEYLTVMREVVRQAADQPVRFLVCSTDPLSAAQFPGLSVEFSTGVAPQDMYALASCDGVCGPPSTFTAWGHTLSGVPLHTMMQAGAPLSGFIPRVRQFKEGGEHRAAV